MDMRQQEYIKPLPLVPREDRDWVMDIPSLFLLSSHWLHRLALSSERAGVCSHFKNTLFLTEDSVFLALYSLPLFWDQAPLSLSRVTFTAGTSNTWGFVGSVALIGYLCLPGGWHK